ncbi:MAG: hypothetical protein HUJ27_15975 [Rhodobacteraceae bacterium]|nr:hypothetical protein [Paracoccaceae bacterium]
MPSLLDRLAYRRTLRRWRRLSGTEPAEVLRGERRAAREAEREIAAARRRIKAGLPPAPVTAPLHADWAWRPPVFDRALELSGLASPESGATLSPEVSVFHDCTLAEFSLRQCRNTGRDSVSRHGLALEVLGFEGSYLSLAIAVPDAGILGLSPHHVLRVAPSCEAERDIRAYARLNLRTGPDTKTILREFPVRGLPAEVDFDLAHEGFQEGQISRAWVDLIFENPALNRITLRDVTLSRRPRADL